MPDFEERVLQPAGAQLRRRQSHRATKRPQQETRRRRAPGLVAERVNAIQMSISIVATASSANGGEFAGVGANRTRHSGNAAAISLRARTAASIDSSVTNAHRLTTKSLMQRTRKPRSANTCSSACGVGMMLDMLPIHSVCVGGSFEAAVESDVIFCFDVTACAPRVKVSKVTSRRVGILSFFGAGTATCCSGALR
jgi:hypothetical protein